MGVTGSAQGSALRDIFHVGSSQILDLPCSHFLVRSEARRDKPRIRGETRNMPPPPHSLDCGVDVAFIGRRQPACRRLPRHCSTARADVRAVCTSSCLRPVRAAFCRATLTTREWRNAPPRHVPRLFLIKSWRELKWNSCSEAQH